tara:strand:- start:143 stop:337 length:195 start_codon:yes stop_codon:yes gene_type:complete
MIRPGIKKEEYCIPGRGSIRLFSKYEKIIRKSTDEITGAKIVCTQTFANREISLESRALIASKL